MLEEAYWSELHNRVFLLLCVLCEREFSGICLFCESHLWKREIKVRSLSRLPFPPYPSAVALDDPLHS